MVVWTLILDPLLNKREARGSCFSGPRQRGMPATAAMRIPKDRTSRASDSVRSTCPAGTVIIPLAAAVASTQTTRRASARAWRYTSMVWSATDSQVNRRCT